MTRADNAVILAGGTGSRFAPLSYEKPKGLIEVKGEVMLERQIRQLQAAGVSDIYLVTGYKKEHFYYLKGKYGVKLIDNPAYARQNSAASLWLARDVIKNSFICSADNYYLTNPFRLGLEKAGSYYTGQYSQGEIAEWGISTDRNGYINQVTTFAKKSWYMLGHAFWSEDFSRKFFQIMAQKREAVAGKFWEEILAENLDQLKMRLARFPAGYIKEFDSLEELRNFDHSYQKDSRSQILKKCAQFLATEEERIDRIKPIKDRSNEAIGFHFRHDGRLYCYLYQLGRVIRCQRLGHPY
ncbi:NTP transferase domain-containing protein [Lactobacillus equicursoris]|uniref:NTP transferase domain-containing protein n=1 Tax=Lactobacillus equicursoris TaxID=420645 RepID=UPI0039936C97